MNVEKLFENLSKILSEKENAKIEIKLIKKRGDEIVSDKFLPTPNQSS